MNLDVRPGKHFVVAQVVSMAPPAVLTFEGDGNGAKAQQAFWGYVQDNGCRSVEFYTITKTGEYIANASFVRRV